MEKNWRSDNGALKYDRNRLTGRFRGAGVWVALALDRKVVNEWVLNGWSYEEMKGNERVVGTPLWANPKLHEGVGYAEEWVLDREVLGWEHRGRRKG